MACIVFIFGALVEYAFLLLQIKINTFKGTKKKEVTTGSGKTAFVAKDEEDGESEEEKDAKKKEEKADRLHTLVRRCDCFALVVFPLCFAIFNLVYWIRFLS